MKDSNTILIAVIGALVIGGAGFFVGRHTGIGFGNQWVSGRPMVAAGGMMRGWDDADDQTGTFRGRAGKGGMGGTSGEITKIDGSAVTIKLSNGDERTVTLSSDATVETLKAGAVSDLKVGATVMITGGGFWNAAQTVIVKP